MFLEKMENCYNLLKIFSLKNFIEIFIIHHHQLNKHQQQLYHRSRYVDIPIVHTILFEVVRSGNFQDGMGNFHDGMGNFPSIKGILVPLLFRVSFSYHIDSHLTLCVLISNDFLKVSRFLLEISLFEI
jgi:hypothetical protein